MSVISRQRILYIPRILLGILIVVCIGYFIIVKQLVQAANPQLISFQGKVVNADGTNVTNGSYNFDFVLYDDVSLGSPSDGIHDKWHELTKSVTVTNGVFQTNLGSATALPDFNANPTLYLAVRFNADSAGYMSPRVRMTSVPYALNSDTVGGLAASSFANTSLSNLSSVAINTSLLPGVDNTIDLGSSAFSFKTLYGDTSILSPMLDIASAGTLSIGTSTATAITLGKVGVTTTNQGALTVAGDSTFTGDIAVNGGDITSTGDLTITPAGGDTNIVGTLDVSGNAAFGNAASPNTSTKYSGNTFNSTIMAENNVTGSLGVDYVQGISNFLTVDPSGSPAYYVYGIDNEVLTATGNVEDFGEIYGSYNTAYHRGSGAVTYLYGYYNGIGNTADGSIGTATGMQLSVNNSGIGTITDGYGLLVDAAYNNTGTFTNNAGIAIAEQALATNNTNLLIGTTSIPAGQFSIYNSSTDDNIFAGKLRVGSTTSPTVALDVTGSGIFTGDIAVNGDDITSDGNLTIAASSGLITLDGASASSIVLADLITDANAVLYTSTTGVISRVAETETSGLCLTSGSGASGIPAWGSCGTGGGYATIQEEGSSLTQRSTLNFIGSTVTCIDNASKTECTISSSGGEDLQGTYGLDANGSDAMISLTSADDSIVISNPSSSGTDSAFTFKIEQLNTGAAVSGLYVDNRGTGNTLELYDVSGDTTPLIVDADGRLGVGTTSISNSASSERLFQVGSETNRGNSVTYGDVVSKGLKQHTALTNIKDIFVYDTTSDSDGGRWIDWSTTDNLSWYTETLNDSPSDPCSISTDTRCYNKAFPRKAILVVTTDSLYIFDAATNDMWMKFSQNSAGWGLGVDTNNDPTSVTALNGVIYVGAKGTASGGLYAFDFVNDRMWRYNGTNRSAADVGISGRNSAVNYNVDSDTKLEISPVGTAASWENVNDVYAVNMTHTISPSAISATTGTNPGYGKVYVALATDGGVTVINIADRTLLQYSDVTDDDYTAVAISRKGQLYALNTTQDQLERWDTIDTDKASEVNGTYTRKWDETVGTGPALATSTFNILPDMPDNLEIVERASLTLDTEDIIYVGHSLGVAELHDHTTQALGWVKYFNSTRESPMMFLGGINDVVLPFDDTSGTQAQDLSLTNTDMAILGSPTLGVDGVQGKAINFDNTNDYLCSDADSNNQCDVDTAWNLSTVGFTLSLWFKHSTTAPSGSIDTIFEKCVNGTPAAAVGCVVAYMNTSGNIVVANDATTTWTRPDGGGAPTYDVTATSTYAYNDNQWHHLVLSRTNASNLNSWIDGNTMNLSTATAQTATYDNSQIVTIGASCSTTVGVNCAAASALNFWDGQIDDVQLAVGTTTQATLTPFQVRRLYNSERPRASKKTITVTDATSANSTSLTDTGESWNVNEFAGQIVEITGSSDSDCVGITRRIVSNTATSMTFTPATPGSCTMDTSADFQVDPEALYGATDSVAGIGITAESPLGEARQLCIGTNSGSDTGGVTCYNHQAGPSIVAEIFHSQASQTDDSGTDWTGSNYDEIRAVDLSTRTLVIASEAHFTSITEDVRLGQGLDYLANQLYMVRLETMLDGITVAGSTGAEIGFTGGADLAENYASTDGLVAGDVVVLEPNAVGSIRKSTSRYQNDLIGVVSTAPGAVLGPSGESSYPVALSGRVPVNITTENGIVKAGDRVTSSSTPGFAMKAVNGGRVLGTVLDDFTEDKYSDCPTGTAEGVYCGQVTIFVNLVDYSGESVDIAMNSAEESGMLWEGSYLDSIDGLAGLEASLTELQASTRQAQLERADKILRYLTGRQVGDEGESGVLVDRVSANEINGANIYAGNIYASSIIVDKIRANQIEGLEIFTDQIKSLSEKLAASQNNNTTPGGDTTQNPTDQNEDQTPEAPTIFDIAMNSVTFKTATVSLDLSVMGILTSNGALVVNGDATFNGAIDFIGRTVFNNDNGGFATIHVGQQDVEIEFTKPYDTPPSISIAVKNGKFVRYSYQAKKEENQLSINYGKVVGFKILLEETATTDVEFSWTAFSIKDPRNAETQLQ